MMARKKLSHVDQQGRARMVDVTGKEATFREARAEAIVSMSAATRRLIASKALPKGNPMETVRLAGLQAVKKTSELIPLCHPLPVSHVDVDVTLIRGGARIEVRVRTKAETGVEMEALTGAAIAALTLYDMCKAVQKDIVIGPVRLLEKIGGKSGRWLAGATGLNENSKEKKRS